VAARAELIPIQLHTLSNGQCFSKSHPIAFAFQATATHNDDSDQFDKLEMILPTIQNLCELSAHQCVEPVALVAEQRYVPLASRNAP